QPTRDTSTQSLTQTQIRIVHQILIGSGATKKRRSIQSQQPKISRSSMAILGRVRFYLSNPNSMFSSMNILML
ncbi:hypothetical protein LINGRAHAP2_LOCUS36789, partial [Linum grandiflorum]